MKASPKQADLQMRLGRIIVFFVLAVVVVAFVAAHVLAWRWERQPFLGLLLEPTLVLSPIQGKGWARLQFDPPLAQPDRLVAIDGRPVERYADVTAILSQHRSGNVVRVSVSRPDGSTREEQITLARFSLRDMFLIFLLPYLAGLAYLGICIWVYWVQGWGRAGQVFAGLCAAIALVVGGIFDLNTTHRLAILWCAAVPFAAAAAMHLAMVFPKEPHFVRRVPVLRLFPYLPATILALRSALSTYDVSRPWEYLQRWGHSYLFAAVGIFFMLGMFVYRLVRPPSPLIRQQSRIILLGVSVAFLPVVPWLLLNILHRPVPFLTPIYAPLFILFPLSIAYAILRYRLLDVDRLLSQGATYAALTFLIVATYFILINGLSQFFAVEASDPIPLSLFVLALTLLFSPLRNWVQRLVDHIFLRETVDYRARLQDFSRELTQILDLEAVLVEVGRQVNRTLYPTCQRAFLYDEERASYIGRFIGRDLPAPPVILMPDGTLARWLRDHQECLYLPVEGELPAELAGDWEQMGALEAVAFVPLHTRERLSGWLALGPKRSGQPYTSDDLAFLSALADQSALAVENARLFARMAERERLERELQLAHEIQQSFMPGQSPALPGWELAFSWRAPRQVAGDFYDFFKLADGRLGLVIADVADKGMPAALFMALTRTLMRAAALEERSPAAALARVNDLLVPDAQQGMFVTAIYAILSLGTGELTYANAGHNLPLVLRSGIRGLERLNKGGMALGVLEGIRLEGHIVALEPGDSVVFYTDGITEAFSPQGNIYGEERLWATIQAVKGGSAQTILDAIDASVVAFAGDTAPSDDRTLMVLRRAK